MIKEILKIILGLFKNKPSITNSNICKGNSLIGTNTINQKTNIIKNRYKIDYRTELNVSEVKVNKDEILKRDRETVVVIFFIFIPISFLSTIQLVFMTNFGYTLSIVIIFSLIIGIKYRVKGASYLLKVESLWEKLITKFSNYLNVEHKKHIFISTLYALLFFVLAIMHWSILVLVLKLT